RPDAGEAGRAAHRRSAVHRARVRRAARRRDAGRPQRAAFAAARWLAARRVGAVGGDRDHQHDDPPDPAAARGVEETRPWRTTDWISPASTASPAPLPARRRRCCSTHTLAAIAAVAPRWSALTNPSGSTFLVFQTSQGANV